MIHNYVFFLLILIYAVLAFFMRGRWSWREWPVYRYGVTVLVTVYLIFYFARYYDTFAERLVIEMDEVLAYVCAMLLGTLLGLLADFCLRCYERWRDEKALRDFFAAQKATTRHRVDFHI